MYETIWFGRRLVLLHRAVYTSSIIMFVYALAFLFLLKLRFPLNQPILRIIARRYGPRILHIFRTYEQTSRKLCKAKLDLKFLKCCKTYNVFPNFIRFKLYKKCLHNTTLYKSWQEKLLNLEINEKTKCCTNLEVLNEQQLSNLKETVSYMDFNCLYVFVSRSVDKLVTRVSNIHEQKLFKLGCKYNLSSFDPNKVIFNHSDKVLSEREKYLLSFGLEFCLPIFKPSFYRHFLSFESLVNRIKHCKILSGKNFDILKQGIQSIAYKYYYGFKSHKVFSPIFTKADIRTLKLLGNNKELIINRPDKGNGVVILRKRDYVSKMNDILKDHTKFEKCIHPDIFQLNLRLEDKVNRLLRKLKINNILNEEEYKLAQHQLSYMVYLKYTNHLYH